jgi:hypothetical protein
MRWQKANAKYHNECQDSDSYFSSCFHLQKNEGVREFNIIMLSKCKVGESLDLKQETSMKKGAVGSRGEKILQFLL